MTPEHRETMDKLAKALSEVLSYIADIIALEGKMTIHATVDRDQTNAKDAQVMLSLNGSIDFIGVLTIAEAFPSTGIVTRSEEIPEMGKRS